MLTPRLSSPALHLWISTCGLHGSSPPTSPWCQVTFSSLELCCLISSDLPTPHRGPTAALHSPCHPKTALTPLRPSLGNISLPLCTVHFFCIFCQDLTICYIHPAQPYCTSGFPVAHSRTVALRLATAGCPPLPGWRPPQPWATVRRFPLLCPGIFFFYSLGGWWAVGTGKGGYFGNNWPTD